MSEIIMVGFTTSSDTFAFPLDCGEAAEPLWADTTEDGSVLLELNSMFPDGWSGDVNSLVPDRLPSGDLEPILSPYWGYVVLRRLFFFRLFEAKYATISDRTFWSLAQCKRKIHIPLNALNTAKRYLINSHV